MGLRNAYVCDRCGKAKIVAESGNPTNWFAAYHFGKNSPHGYFCSLECAVSTLNEWAGTNMDEEATARNMIWSTTLEVPRKDGKM